MATILIDNYDSFTWNVYQFLSASGADVTVFRNDQTTLEHLISLNPRNIVLSPGPGSPGERTGICEKVLAHFEGKIPVLGVCLGQQLMYERYGGKVTLAGEIQHGKVSTITHDGKGLFRGLPQGLSITRYHSLAGLPRTLPDILEVNSWTANGLIMGARHRVFTVTGVQFHPESILSQEGMTMMRNFLALEGGTWAENPNVLVSSLDAPVPQYNVSMWEPHPDSAYQTIASSSALAAKTTQEAPNKKESILDKIYRQRRLDVMAAKDRPGQSLADLEAQLAVAGTAPVLLEIIPRIMVGQIKHGGSLSVMAEVKRASPSKGNIAIDAVAAEEGLKYAQAGAAVISVLTEPTWFKGTLDDLRSVRQAIDNLPERPAVLRKDFIFDIYQIAEARLAGADCVLLIVAMLSDAELAELMAYARRFGMEPLVEVNSVEELDRAVHVGARLVGINNRNLHTFQVDLGISSEVAAKCPPGVMLAALSGISAPQDVRAYKQSGINAVLIGEALMRADDKAQFIRDLVA
ncbi:anthranilate synthase / indole-3-glycerol phosphate synthase [Tieghemiomyces parasiticus]|uniref:Multifunctional tryptophan biosynthesis protein n=1 Tax=Tieghemiomyces parasiticus TaxID=78921 RepID=A0A9W8A0T5_9FUNG|nr:anthranilate synthase / indole-3-glycerol phosphate synthase [Tieghemiomyces parasiticus]